MENQDIINKQNDLIKQWGSKVTRQLKANVSSMFPGGKPQSNVIKNRSDVNSFVIRKNPPKTQFESFVEKGNSAKSTITLKNSLRDKYFNHDGDEIDMLTITFARHGIFVIKGVGKGPRVPRDFINPIIDKEFPVLADKIGELNADQIQKVIIKKIK
jgi:hypothetical protein